MSIIDPGLQNQETSIVQSIHSIIEKNRIPLNAYIHLTYSCNFKCLHCYQKPVKHHIGSLSSNEWIKIFDILRAHKTMNIVMTGGEPTLHKDFKDIYLAAFEKGFKITVLTNGGFKQPQISNLLITHRPHIVSITLYGASNDTYKRFTGVNNGWDTVKTNIINLLDQGVKIYLKTVANKINKEDIPEMFSFARKLDLSIHCFTSIHCDLAGGPEPLRVKLDPAERIELLKLTTSREGFANYLKQESSFWQKGIKKCYAGIGMCNIDPLGNVFLCEVCEEPKFNIFENGFEYCWQKISLVREEEIEKNIKCGNCASKMICGLCAPSAKKDFGSLDIPDKYCDELEVIRNFYSKLLEE